MRVPSIERYFDERHAAFNEPPGQEAALTEKVAAIGIPQFVRLLLEIERLDGGGTHHRDSTPISSAMALGGDAGVLGEKFLLHLVKHGKPGIGALGVHVARQIEVLH